jgi:putative PIN family toxin of toxin-antitoxin system
MKKRLFVILFLCVGAISVFAQDLDKDYQVMQVNKKVRDITVENPYTSPLENYIARIHSWIEGKYQPVYSEMLDVLVRQLPQEPYSPKAAEWMLNCEMEQAITYKDSIGLVFRKDDTGDCYAVGMSQWENEKWLGTGEDICFAKNMNDAKQYIENKSVERLLRLRKFEQLKKVSTDTLAFINYLNVNGQDPVSYLLNKLKNHQLVIYGEVHFRKNSWELLRRLIQSPEFSANTGTIFLELSQNAQLELDMFFNNATKDPNIILDIFRKEELAGWSDRGMYDFLLELWDINHNIKDPIKVITTDHPRTFYQNIISKAQYDSIERTPCDRNEIMAEIIENTLLNSSDKRNNLYIVGWGHAYKSPALLLGSWQINGLSAGYLLSGKLGKENVFSIFPHTVNMTNNGVVFGRIRNGLFDYVFSACGNRPVAFDLHNSPFGNELFVADEILEEVASVMARPKFKVNEKQIDFFIKSISEIANNVVIDGSVAGVCRDSKDDKILECAYVGNADYIITGDDDLLTLEEFRGIRILTGSEYMILISTFFE